MREVQEECGLTLNHVAYVGSQSCEVIAHKRVLLVFFYGALPDPQTELCLSEEHTEFGWIDIAGERPADWLTSTWRRVWQRWRLYKKVGSAEWVRRLDNAWRSAAGRGGCRLWPCPLVHLGCAVATEARGERPAANGVSRGLTCQLRLGVSCLRTQRPPPYGQDPTHGIDNDQSAP